MGSAEEYSEDFLAFNGIQWKYLVDPFQSSPMVTTQMFESNEIDDGKSIDTVEVDFS